MSSRLHDIKPPRALIYGGLALVLVSFIPIAIIANARASKTTKPRVALIQHMTAQEKFKPQTPNPMFADGRAMRPPVAGTVPFGPMRSMVVETGRENGQFVHTIPVPVTEAMVRRGRERYGIYCSPCHGLAGYGDGLVARRAEQLQEGTWTPPTSLHTDQVRNRQNGHIFNTITNGIRNMTAYGSQIEPEDRWAIVAYVRALQRSQKASPEDIPADRRAAVLAAAIPLPPEPKPEPATPSAAAANAPAAPSTTPSPKPEQPK